VPITSVTVPPFFAVPVLPVLPEGELLDELPHAAMTTTDAVATTAVKADLEKLLIKKVLLLLRGSESPAVGPKSSSQPLVVKRG
jgi:hypothetical protein